MLIWAHLDSSKKVVYHSTALLIWDCTDFSFDGFLEFRGGFEVALVYHVFQISSRVEVWVVEIEGMRGPVGVTPPVDESTGELVVQLLQGGISAVFRVASFCWNHCAPLTILFLPCLPILTINSCSGPPGCVPSSRSLSCPVYPQNILEIERSYNAIFRYNSPRGYTKSTSEPFQSSRNPLKKKSEQIQRRSAVE